MYENPVETSECKSLSANRDAQQDMDIQEEKWRWSFYSDDKGTSGFSRNICKLQQTSIINGDANGKLEAISKGGSSTFSFVFVIKGKLDLIDMKKRRLQTISAGTATASTDQPDLKVKIHSGCSWAAYQVPITTLRENFERWMHRPYFQEQTFAPLHDFRTGGAAALYQTLCYVREDLATAAESSRHVLAGVYERLLLAKLFMTKADNIAAMNDLPGRRASPRYLQRAEIFMRENIHSVVTVDEIARAAGCSARALQRMFKEYRDKSPMQVLCEYRLSAAHQIILGGEARNVTDLAIHLQFSNPGRFSALYREAYGMSPSRMIRFHEKNT